MSNSIMVKLDFGDTILPVGTLFYSKTMNKYLFAFEKDFLKTGYQISPLFMPLADKTYPAEYMEPFHGIHGVFADSLPDSWGMQVQNLEFEKIGILEPTVLDRLAFIGKYSMGALRYEPSKEFKKRDEILKLADLRKATQKIIQGDVDHISEELLQSGGSAGGARPKFLVDINQNNPLDIRYTAGHFDKDYVSVLIKVPSKDSDVWQRSEYVHSRLAKKAGITIPETYLLQGKKTDLAYFAIKRFDILDGGGRLHMHTIAGMLNENYETAKIDYSTLFRTIENVTNDHTQVVEAYRRMAFNVLSYNRDDHLKNFMLCMNKKGQWTLSPAYDMGFSKGRLNAHAMSINGKQIHPSVKDFRIIAEDFRVKQWKEILGTTIDTLKQYSDEAKKAGLPDKTIYTVNSLIKEQTKRIGKDLAGGMDI